MKLARIIFLAKKMTFLLLFFSCIFVFKATHGYEEKYAECPSDLNEPWSYGFHLSNGKDYWGEKYPSCYGRLQSPISIKDHEKTIYSKYLKPLRLYNYNQPVTKALIENNGHTIKITPKDGVVRSFLVNSPFTYEEGTKFTLDQIHIHFGIRFYRGTEHILHNKKFALEMHFVHSDKNGNNAVIAVLYQRVEEDNKALKGITDNLKSVVYKNDRVTVEDAILLDQLVLNNSSYFRYNGSLTTPPCTEGVSWTISKNLHKIGMNQWNELQKLKRTEKKNIDSYFKNVTLKAWSCTLADNFREEQPDYDRMVFTSLPTDKDDDYPWN